MTAARGRSLQGWGTSAEVRYYVKVPANTKVLLSTTNGQIDVVDVTAAAHLETVNGPINARGLGGEVKASTVNGGVDIALAALTGDVNVETTNGGVTVRLPADAKAVLLGRTTNGGLSVDRGLSVEEVERSRRRLEVKLNGGGRRVEAETTNGGITFTAAKVVDRPRRSRDSDQPVGARPRGQPRGSRVDASAIQPARNASPPNGVTAPHVVTPVHTSSVEAAREEQHAQREQCAGPARSGGLRRGVRRPRRRQHAEGVHQVIADAGLEHRQTFGRDQRAQAVRPERAEGHPQRGQARTQPQEPSRSQRVHPAIL